eukprot:gene16695-19848_t
MSIYNSHPVGDISETSLFADGALAFLGTGRAGVRRGFVNIMMLDTTSNSLDMSTSFLTGFIICFDLGTSVGFQKKNELTKYVKDRGAVVDLALSQRTTHLICSADLIGGFKAKSAAKIPSCYVVIDRFIYDLVNANAVPEDLCSYLYYNGKLVSEVYTFDIIAASFKETYSDVQHISSVLQAERAEKAAQKAAQPTYKPIILSEAQQKKKDALEKKRLEQEEALEKKKKEKEEYLEEKKREKEEKLRKLAEEKEAKALAEAERRKSVMATLTVNRLVVPPTTSSFTTFSQFFAQQDKATADQRIIDEQQQAKSKQEAKLEREKSRIAKLERERLQKEARKAATQQDIVDARNKKEQEKDARRFAFEEAKRIETERAEAEKSALNKERYDAFLKREAKRLAKANGTSSYAAQEDAIPADQRKIFVGGITFDDLAEPKVAAAYTRGAALKVKRKRVAYLLAYFDTFGPISDRTVKWAQNHFFVTYVNPEDAKKAVEHFAGKETGYANKQLAVEGIRAKLKEYKKDVRIAPTPRFYVKFPKAVASPVVAVPSTAINDWDE